MDDDAVADLARIIDDFKLGAAEDALRISQLEEALQLCLMRFKECGAKGHDRIIYMITKLLTRK